jgi:hypothetical protein
MCRRYRSFNCRISLGNKQLRFVWNTECFQRLLELFGGGTLIAAGGAGAIISGCALVAPGLAVSAGGLALSTAGATHAGVGYSNVKDAYKQFSKDSSGGSRDSSTFAKGAGKVDVPKLPSNARVIKDPKTVYNQLEKYHGIDPKLASERLHEIKQAAGRGPADNVVFNMTGNVFAPSAKMKPDMATF